MTTPLPVTRVTATLLGASVIAGPLYIIVGLAQLLLREGFDVRRHALSLLSNGDWGWIQIASFLLSGLLVIAGAIGIRRALHGSLGGTWGPILFGIYGIGLLGAGLFVADPGQGFPPGTPMKSAGLSSHGMLHFVFGGIGFYSLIAACFVFGRRFLRLKQLGWAIYSMFSGTAFFFAFAAIASGSKEAAVMLAFYAAVAWIWLWHSALSARLLFDQRLAAR